MRDGTDVRSNQGPFPRSPVRSHAWLPVPLNPRRLLSPLGYLNVGRAGVSPALLRRTPADSDTAVPRGSPRVRTVAAPHCHHKRCFL